MEIPQWFMFGVVMFILMALAAHMGNDLYIFYREIQDTKTEIRAEVVDELEAVYDTEDAIILNMTKNNNEYIKYNVLVENTIKQVIYFKGTREVKIVE